jgi:hypothetical protein
MQVAAFCTPVRPDWRWRIVNYAGEMVEESRESFASIAAALSDGHRRLRELGDEDMSSRAPTFYRSTSHLRSR